MKILIIGSDLNTPQIRKVLQESECEVKNLSSREFAVLPQEDKLTADAAIVGRDHGDHEALKNGICLEKVPFVAAIGAENIAANISTLSQTENMECNQYILYGGEENLRALVAFIRYKLYGDPKPSSPQQIPFDGIYTPDGVLCQDPLDYIRKYEAGYDTYVGIVNYRTRWLAGDMEVELTLKEALNRRGIGVILVFSAASPDSELNCLTMDQAVEKFFMNDGKLLIDVLVNFIYFGVINREGESLYDKAALYFEELNIPVLHPVQSYHYTNKQWEGEKAPFQTDTAMCFDTPEMQGMIEPVFLGGVKEQKLHDVIPERAEKIAGRVAGWIALRRKANADKKLVFMLNNAVCSGVEATLGKATGLNSFESVIRVLKKLEAAGYQVGEIPTDGEDLRKLFLERKAYSDFRWTSAEDVDACGGTLYAMTTAEYREFYDRLPKKVRCQMEKTWGSAPGEAMVLGEKILITGIRFGNILLMIQPKRGCYGAKCTGEVCRILQDPSCPPTHQYLATYYYAAEIFGADAWVHVGTHGSLEFLPGKASGLSEECYSDIAVGEKPNLYIYNPELLAAAMLAKRRAYAVIVDHTPKRNELHRLEEYEIDSLLRGVNGGFIKPGAGGTEEDAPETGRNLYGIQIDRIPTKEAYMRGAEAAEALIARYLAEEGRYPEQIVLNMISLDIPRTKGEQVSLFLHLLGVSPCWNERGIVTGLELIPLKVLRRPRMDVSAHISGVLRDTWPSVFIRMDEAVTLAATAEEKPEDNYVIKSLKKVSYDEKTHGIARIFGTAPGMYSSGISLALKASAWKTEEDLGRYFIDSSSYVYGKNKYGEKDVAAFLDGVKRTDLTCDVISMRHTDALACSYSSRVQGGYALAAKSIGLKKKPHSFIGESDESGISVKTLKEHVNDGLNQTLFSKEWKTAQMKHGYDGAAEIMRYIQSIFEIQCLNESFTDQVLDQLAEEYMIAEEMRYFMQENNLYAGEECIRRFLELESRGKWKPSHKILTQLQKSYLKAEAILEDGLCGRGDVQGSSVEIVGDDRVNDWKARIAATDLELERWKKQNC